MTADRVVLGISGASGTPLAVRTAEALADHVAVHTVVSDGAKAVMAHETDDREETLDRLATVSEACYDEDEYGAAIASGTFQTAGMAVVPCSMNTLAKMAVGMSDTLLTRAAAVTMKEDRPLVVVPRESPMDEVHLENLHEMARRGATVVPPVLGFYYDPEDLDDVVDHVVGKILERFDLEFDAYRRWTGTE
ncbi:MAG: UbiX family flavin prenyltransferase [Halanaeroarchaeum sp.]